MGVAMPEDGILPAFAQRFFSAPNELLWEDFEQGRMDEATSIMLQPWIDRLAAGAELAILPSVQGGVTTWYVASRDHRVFHHARESLVAFLGPSYSDFNGQPTFLDETNPVESALAAEFGSNTVRLRIHSRSFVHGRLKLFADLLAAAPERTETLRRPAGRILSDFEESLRRHEKSSANLCIEELRHAGYLDAQNLMFLQIRLDEMREDWPAILRFADRYHLKSGRRRPRRVSQAILRAIYAQELASYERSGDVQGALEHFNNTVLNSCEGLLSSRTTYRCVEADVAFLMLDITQGKSTQDLQAMLEGLPASTTHREWLQRILDVGSASPVNGVLGGDPAVGQNQLTIASLALHEGDLDKAWILVSRLEPSEAAVRIALECACDMGTLDAAQRALDIYEALPDAARSALESSRTVARNVVSLREFFPDKPTESDALARIPQNWSEWCEALQSDPHWTESVSVAEQGAIDWPPEEFEQNASVARIADALEKMDDAGQPGVIASLPYLLDSISQCQSLPKTMARVMDSLLLIHLLDSAPGRQFYGTLADLCDLRLGIGVTDQAYGEFLSESLVSIQSRAAATDLDGLLEFIEVLGRFPSPDEALRQAIGEAVCSVFSRFSQRVTPVQLAMLEQLAIELNCSVPDELQSAVGGDGGPGQLNPLLALAGKSIALYSLQESVLRQAKDLLSKVIPEGTVATFHDKVGGSAALKRASRESDIFVVATASAKHAATGYIDQNRPPGSVILRPGGKGFTSMIKELENHGAVLQESLSEAA
jgi:hypothetical protein